MMQALYHAFVAGDLVPLYQALSPDIVWNSHGHPASPFHGVYQGKSEVQTYFSHSEEVELEKFDLHTLVQQDNRVIALADVRRVTKRTGVITEGQFVHVWTWDGGKITHADIYEASANLKTSRYDR